MDHDVLGYALKKEIGIFQRRDEKESDTKVSSENFIDIVVKRQKQLGRVEFLVKYQGWKMTDFNIVYELNGERNIFNLAKKESRLAGNEQIDELIRRYTDKWD